MVTSRRPEEESSAKGYGDWFSEAAASCFCFCLLSPRDLPLRTARRLQCLDEPWEWNIIYAWQSHTSLVKYQKKQKSNSDTTSHIREQTKTTTITPSSPHYPISPLPLTTVLPSKQKFIENPNTSSIWQIYPERRQVWKFWPLSLRQNPPELRLKKRQRPRSKWGKNQRPKWSKRGKIHR